jgi:hypothetical protein
MGIDRHEWEHRNYKSGREKTARPADLDDDATLLAPDQPVDADAVPIQPEMPPAKKRTPKRAAAKK